MPAPLLPLVATFELAVTAQSSNPTAPITYPTTKPILTTPTTRAGCMFR